MIGNPRGVLKLVLIAPGKFGIAIVSPPLDGADNNSERTQHAIIATRNRNSNIYAVMNNAALPQRRRGGGGGGGGA